MTPRLLLCRPQGGLNDMLCQIAAACEYGERYGRAVIIDANHATTDCFRDDLSHYFESLRPDLSLDTGAAPTDLAGLDVVPHCLIGRIHAYDARYQSGLWKWVEATTGEPITFDFDRDYDEAVLVHQSDGGGEGSIGALARMRLQPHMLRELERRLGLIGQPFLGVHVRNSDYRTNYQAAAQTPAFLDSSRPVFVATDDRKVIDHFIQVLGRERVFSFAALPIGAPVPIHRWPGELGRRRLNEDAILDLVMLALASQFYMFGLEPNFQQTKFSGYSLLAANLRRRPEVLSSLIGRLAVA
jgi:hypothetical protein